MATLQDDKYSKLPVHEDWLENSENDIAMDTKYLALDNEPLATTNGPTIAVELVFIPTPLPL